MRIIEKLTLLDKISAELAERFNYVEIDTLLAHYKVEEPEGNWNDSNKQNYIKIALRYVDNDIVLQLADELGLGSLRSAAAEATLPRNWAETPEFRLFISHISAHKDRAKRLKDCLRSYGISGFVAHEDIHPTAEWQIEIERALFRMDAFLAIHTLGFSKSFWTQQEIGFAVGRGTKIISFKMGEDPTGFIAKRQALPRRDRTAEDIAKEVDAILTGSPLTRTKLVLAKKALGLVKDKEAAIDFSDEIPF